MSAEPLPTRPIRISNPMRVIVPIVTGALVLLMFIPPLFVADFRGGSGWKIGGGIAILVFCLIWQARSALRSPWAMTIEDRLVVRRLFRESPYDLGRVKKWWFAIPDGKPTQSPPTTNGVLYVVFDDGTRFRGEVTAEEATRIAAILPPRV